MQTKDIMTKGVVTVSPEATILETAEILWRYNFNGLPVVDENQKIIGIVTEGDFLTKQVDFAEIHLPTYIKFLKDLEVYKKDKEVFVSEAKKILAAKVKDIMTTQVITVLPETEVYEVAQLFVEKRINPIPVVDSNKTLVGIVSRSDLIRFLKDLKNL